jgi:hypothetical protein
LLSYWLNADPRKKIIAFGKAYFAIKTRERELSEKEYLNMTEEERRIYKRNKTKKAIIFSIKLPKMQELKILINFVMLVIEVYIMERPQTILQKGRGLDIAKIFLITWVVRN